jgi:hypothetical protein
MFKIEERKDGYSFENFGEINFRGKSTFDSKELLEFIDAIETIRKIIKGPEK